MVVRAERKERGGLGHVSQFTTSEAEPAGGGDSRRIDAEDLSRFEGGVPGRRADRLRRNRRNLMSRSTNRSDAA